jgi:hypothetical protein
MERSLSSSLSTKFTVIPPPPPTPNASVLVEEEEGGGGEALGERVGSEGKQEAKAVRSVAPAC